MRIFGSAVALVVGLALATTAFSQQDHYVSGYTKANGTYVAPHYQTNPNTTRNDNYSTQGNTNPYTGQQGTKPRDNDPYAPKQQQQPQQNDNPYGH